MGSTDFTLSISDQYKDHPHIHGEHDDLEGEELASVGSPPYTWGAPKREGMNRSEFGIIPIYMGSTCLTVPGTGSGQDHPHIHGEHIAHCR